MLDFHQVLLDLRSCLGVGLCVWSVGGVVEISLLYNYVQLLYDYHGYYGHMICSL